MPWSGHSARYAMADIYRAIQDNNLVLIFVNTRSQAELIFQELWTINEDALPIALHHGSLDVGQRRKVEAAMADGQPEGGGLHIDPRSWHRLGRCGSGDQCRRAEGSEPL